MGRISLTVGTIFLTFSIVWYIWGQPYLDQSHIVVYQILVILNLPLLNNISYPDLFESILVFLIVVGIGLLTYGRIDRFIRYNNREQIITLVKIFVIVIIIALGFAFISNGLYLLKSSPNIPTQHYRYMILNLGTDGRNATFLINLFSNELVPIYPIPTGITLKIPELKNESSIVKILFPNAAIQYSQNDSNIIENKIIELKYRENNGTFSTYSAAPILTYPYAGKFDAILTIENNTLQIKNAQLGSTNPISKITLNSLISIDSFEAYQIQQQNMTSIGLSLLVVGLSIISITGIVIALIELTYKYAILKRQRFYQ